MLFKMRFEKTRRNLQALPTWRKKWRSPSTKQDETSKEENTNPSQMSFMKMKAIYLTFKKTCDVVSLLSYENKTKMDMAKSGIFSHCF